MARATDTLFVAMTRPPMKWGVVFDGFKANAILTMILTVVVIGRPPGFLIGVLVHFALRELCRVDPHFFWKFRLYYKTKMRSMTKHLWGGSRLQPTQTRVRNAGEMPAGV